jgi:aminoglycoside/choline kinase family phosphotransferase
MEAIEWARAHGASGDVVVVSEQPWARVTRIGGTWLKECAPVQAYEVPLTAALAARWPDRVPEVLAADAERGLLLLADAGTPIAAVGDAGDAWEAALPLYAELQRDETPHAEAHLARGVPDLRPEVLPARFEAWAGRDPRLETFVGRFAELCASLSRPSTVQHDDLHEANVFARDGRITFLDWGDACIAHPFSSLYITCRWVEHYRGADAARRVRAAYLEAWDADDEELDRVLPVAAFARMVQWERIGDTESADRHLEWFLENIASS